MDRPSAPAEVPAMYSGSTARTPKKASRSPASMMLAIQKFQPMARTWASTGVEVDGLSDMAGLRVRGRGRLPQAGREGTSGP